MKREDLIAYIRSNNKKLKELCFKRYTFTQLVILKVSTELELEKNNKNYNPFLPGRDGLNLSPLC